MTARRKALADPKERSYPMINLSEEQIIHHLRRALDASPDAEEPHYSALLSGKPIPAAVLIPLLHHEGEWHLLLTRRNSDLQEHSGQVAFPGGRADSEDGSPETTALREAYEEIGLAPGDVRLLGRLRQYRTITNYCVTPVVGAIPWPYSLRLANEEVSRAFTIPLNWLADPDNHEIQQRKLPPPYGTVSVIHFHSYDGEVLWGASARLTLILLDALGGIRESFP
jgi:8-oxo-dGTP pyrophosphatase MutT (NUDIX family)